MYKIITDWSEVWALLIPLFFMLKNKNTAPYLRPVRLYVVLAFLINLMAIVIQEYKHDWGMQRGDFFYSNNFLYNIHSVVRFFLFSWFFALLNQRFMHRLKKILPFAFLLFLLINFTLYENFFNRYNLSSRLLATEAALILFYCLQYYIFLLVEDKGIPLKKQPGIWIVTGLIFYVAANFFIYLFYDYLLLQAEEFAIKVWDVHNLFYILLCICMAVSLNKKDDK